ncbi:hypothetical protein LZ31DRAFT_216155 [Colletotrichum somersetense]|nr:hypothetical protein LZ31DRAFT_216155 [Colletotrichum somersetense]
MRNHSLIETAPHKSPASSSGSGTSCDVELVEPYNDNNSYTVGWVCTTNTDHLASQAFLEVIYTERRFISMNDRFNCTFGSVGEHKIVIVCLRSGETVTTGVTTSMGLVCRRLSEIFPRLSAILVVGTGAGVPFTRHDVRLGDVVVGACSSSTVGGVIDYDITSEPDGFEIRYIGDVVRPVPALQLAVEQLENHHVFKGTCFDQSIRDIIEKHPKLSDAYKRPKFNKDQFVVEPQHNSLFKESHTSSSDLEDTKKYTPPRRDPEKEPKVRYGTIASSSQPLKRAEFRDRIAGEMDVLCFDVGTAAKGKVPRLVVRGICHYADSSDNYQWEGYAAMAAAAYAKDFLKYNPPQTLREEPVGRDFSGFSASATGIPSELHENAHPRSRPVAGRQYLHGYNDLSMVASTLGTDPSLDHSIRFSRWDPMFHQTALVVIFAIFFMLSGASIATAISQSREPACDPRPKGLRTDDGFWMLLSQLFLQVLSIYCTVYPVALNKELKLSIAGFWFWASLAASFATTVTAAMAYAWSWQVAAVLSFTSSFAQVIPAGQLAASLGPDNAKWRARRTGVFKAEEGHYD